MRPIQAHLVLVCGTYQYPASAERVLCAASNTMSANAMELLAQTYEAQPVAQVAEVTRTPSTLLYFSLGRDDSYAERFALMFAVD